MATTLYRALRQSSIAAATFTSARGLRAEVKRVDDGGTYRLTDKESGQIIQGGYHNLVPFLRVFNFDYRAGQPVWEPVAPDGLTPDERRELTRPEFPTYIGWDNREHAEF